MIDNSDGLFDNVDQLLPKNTKGRRLNLTSFTLNDKLNVKVLKKQMQIAKFQSEVDQLKNQMQEAQEKVDAEQLLEKKIRDEIQQKTAILYDQKVNELRMEFEQRFNLEVQKFEQNSQANSNPPQIIPQATQINTVRYTYAQHPVFPNKQQQIPVFNPQPNMITTRDGSDSDKENTYNELMK